MVQKSNIQEIIVSVVIPLYARPNTVSKTVGKLVDTKTPSLEIICVDDNGNNENSRKTQDSLRDYWECGIIKYICHLKNLNGAAARNTGLLAANGQHVIFLDDDDELQHGYIVERIDFLKKNTNVDIVTGRWIEVHSSGLERTFRCKDKNIDFYDVMAFRVGWGSTSNLFMRTRFARAIGGFDEDFSRHQDIEFMARAVNAGRVVSYSGFKRVLLKNLSSRINVSSFENFVCVKETLFRKFESGLTQLSEAQYDSVMRVHMLDLARNAILSRGVVFGFKFCMKQSRLGLIDFFYLYLVWLSRYLKFSN